jgi:hypothetical protein|tara:strand:- start:4837 stop:5184 length:348 start_codon:yes stop_codon:yes gene_type:complete
MADDKNTVNVDRADYDAMRDKIAELESAEPAATGGWRETSANAMWVAPEYFSRWRLFPRAFISMYIYLLYEVVTWFMLLTAPVAEQAALVSVVVGAGAAWFGLYVNSTAGGGKDK